MVKARYGGQEYKVPEETTELKHVTPVHFTLAAIDKDGKVGAVIGEPYILTGKGTK
jgi:hypothetical protein